ncbi:GNAT family N-acetyltransferase [Arhodomonas sp. SL1]|uniref:GNAT family N-acetyltransferase n=1 Tax=Arhodomonas sp. SL1 TaxID=3425691 RepID=UPI003F884B79
MVPTADINAAFEAWLEGTEPATPARAEDNTGLRHRRLGHAIGAVDTESDYLVLCRIETDPGHRGHGEATALLELLKGICERFHVTLLGQATAYEDTGLDQAALLAWYERHGFQIDRERTAQPLVWYPRRPW